MPVARCAVEGTETGVPSFLVQKHTVETGCFSRAPQRPRSQRIDCKLVSNHRKTLKFASKNSIEPGLFDGENVHHFCRKSGCSESNMNVFRSSGLTRPHSIVLGISYRMLVHEKQDYPLT